jgi:TM2 domain-containing membrane protein YozV
MIGTICPYCRGAIEADSAEQLICEGCGTQHHPDCYAENGGCTVFGCRCAPAEEPKVSIAAPDLVHAATGDTARTYSASSPPPPPLPGMAGLPSPPTPPTPEPTIEQIGASVVPSIFGSCYNEPAAETVHEPKSRTGFILLGALLGAFGAHNFYAGYKKKGLAQLAITVVTLGFAGPMTWIWAIIDICTIDRDNYGVNFTS